MKMSKRQCLNSIFIISRIIRKKRIKIKISKKVSNLVKKKYIDAFMDIYR